MCTCCGAPGAGVGFDRYGPALFPGVAEQGYRTFASQSRMFSVSRPRAGETTWLAAKAESWAPALPWRAAGAGEGQGRLSASLLGRVRRRRAHALDLHAGGGELDGE